MAHSVPACWRWAQPRKTTSPLAKSLIDAPIKSRQQEHVKLQGIHHDLHAGVINDEFFCTRYKGVNCASDPARSPISEETSSRKLHKWALLNGIALIFFRRAALSSQTQIWRIRVEAPLGVILRISTTPGRPSCSRPELQILGLFPARESGFTFFENEMTHWPRFSGRKLGRGRAFCAATVHAGCAAGF